VLLFADLLSPQSQDFTLGLQPKLQLITPIFRAQGTTYKAIYVVTLRPGKWLYFVGRILFSTTI
jgi:hypothetical protein